METEVFSQLQLYLDYLRNIKFASGRTVLAYGHDLRKLAGFLDSKHTYKVGHISEALIEEFLANTKGESPANFSRKLYAIKGFCKYLARKGFPAPEISIKAPKNHHRNISYLTDIEARRLLEVVANSHLPYFAPRDTAIVSLLLNTGIRVSELTNLRIKDFEDVFGNSFFINITRKGGDESRLPVSPNVAENIKNYLLKRETQPDEPLFLSRKGNRIKQNTVYWLVRSYLEKAGIKKEKMGPHVLRHTVGTSLRAKGFDLVTIQKLLGHKKLETTSIYMHVEPKDLERAVIALNY